MGCGCHRKYKKYYFDLHLMSSEIYIIFFFLLFFPSCLSSAFYFYFPQPTVEFPNLPPNQNRKKIERIQLYIDQKVAQTTEFAQTSIYS